MSWLLRTEPCPFTVETEAVLTAWMPSWVRLGWVGVEVSRDRGEDDVRAGRAGQSAQERELRWRGKSWRIAGRRLCHSGLETGGQVDGVELVGLVTAEDGQRIGRTDRVDRQRSR